MHKPILFTTLGFPGSGKTYFARRFAKDIVAFHLSSDIVRNQLFPKPRFTSKENRMVFGMMDYIAEELRRCGVSVVCDANFNKRAYRKRLRRIAKKCGARYLLLRFQTPIATALKRLGYRRALKAAHVLKHHRPIPDNVLFLMKKKIEEPM